ncbi:histidine triad nucleotide-binding protein [Ktedonospora formicarum]|uniref:Histidine triad nucleotide-binding protein n=1 Tax=Ktedonospora formicarum TaxID=2778364 RepID=A0A8J3MRF2_9CHLR|nr:histidine triad nucleotide-binding protein [Ktedonospora formicarum]GHO44980.1 histidine triad nucleotide-binding protein [Ktedonospora formicarum]
MADCLFCKIVAGEIPSKIVHQDNDVVAFEDINPQAPTHILVIPTRHIESMQELTQTDGETLARLFTVASQIAAERGLEQGYRFVTNVGPDAGQSVQHLHFHLIGGRAMGWPPFPPDEQR